MKNSKNSRCISAINGKTLVITFNKAVDKDTVITSGGMLQNVNLLKLTGAESITGNAVTAELSEDGKTLTVTPGTTEYFKGDYAVEVTTNVKSTGEIALEAKSTTLIKVADIVAPTFVSATAAAKTTTNNVELAFSEPVLATSAVVKINGVASSVATGTTLDKLNVTTAANLVPGTTYTVQILNLKDFAGNILPAYDTTVTVVADIAAPTVTNVSVISDSSIEVTFDKAMDIATLDNTTVKLLDGNSTDLASENITGITPKADTSNKVFIIALDNSPALPFVSGTFNGTLVFTNNVADLLGNKITPVNKAVTITKDTVVPAVTGITFKKAGSAPTYAGVSLTTGALVVKFSEAVTKDATIAATNWKLIDNTGADVTSTYITSANLTASKVNTLDPTELIIPLNTAVTTVSGITTFTVRMPASQVDDLSLSANKNAANVNTVSVSAGTSTTTDLIAPVVSYNTATASNEIKLNVVEDVALDNSTVLDVNNYRLDGAPLPSGSYITIGALTDGAYHVSVFLPSGTTTASRNYALTVSGIKDVAGNTAATLTSNIVGLTDDVKPEIKTATLNTNGSLTLGYSELLSTNIANSDLVITLNNKIVDAGSVAVVDGVGADAGKDVVTVTQSVDEGGDGVYGGGNDTLFIDINGTPGYQTGDILISKGSYASTDNAVAYNLTKASTLKLGTITTPTSHDVNSSSNTLKGDASFTIK